MAVQTTTHPPGQSRAKLSRPSMLPHSMSLGPLPAPDFANPGPRSVPASSALTGIGEGRTSRLGESPTTPSEGWTTPPPGSALARSVGSVGEKIASRKSNMDVWLGGEMKGDGGSASLESAEDGREGVPAKVRPLDKMPDLVRGKSMPLVPSALGTARPGARKTAEWEEPDGPGSAAVMASLRRDSTSAQTGASLSPAANGRPLLNRAPGSRDNLSSLGTTPNGTASASPRKAPSLHQAPPSSLAFSMIGDAPAQTAEASLPARRSQSSLDLPEMAASAAAASEELSRRAAQAPFANLAQPADSLIEGMTGLGLHDVPPLEASGLPRPAADSADSSPSITAPALRLAATNGAISTPRQQPLPAARYPGPNVPDAFSGPGWNPYYLRSPLNASTSALAADPGAGGYPYELRRDSGYGPSPPQTQDLRRGSYSPSISASSLAFSNNLRRSQSSWGAQDAFAQAAAVAAAGLPQHQRHLSHAFGSSGGASPWQAQHPYASSPQLPYGTMPSPALVPMDAAAAALNGFASPLLAQQQQLRQTLAAASSRQSLEYGQLAAAAAAAAAVAQPSYMNSPYGLAYGLPSSTPAYHSPQQRSSFDGGRNIMRSPLLEEFRANRHRRWELRDVLGNIVDFARDQLGSRHIQSKLDVASADERELVFSEIIPSLLDLSMDVFANYVVQKFFELGTQTQKGQLMDAIRGHILELSVQMYGTRVVQKALEHVVPDVQRSIMRELEGSVLTCAKDQNANHVLQRSLERLDPPSNAFISEAFVGEAFDLATNSFGCRVLQRTFEHLPEHQVRPLLNELHGLAQQVFLDGYGNYIAQWVISDGPKADRNLMISKIKGQIFGLSKHKFASNVVEKAIMKAEPDDLRAMVDEILVPTRDGRSTVGEMLRDAFANFPLQKFLQAAREPQRGQLFDETAAQLAHMRRYSLSFGKYLVAIERLIVNERGPTSFQAVSSAPQFAHAYV